MRPRPVVALLWPLVALLVLGAGWERFSERFTADRTGPLLLGPVVMQASSNLGRTLAELPPPESPRIAIFGSSQIANVKGADRQPRLSFPYRLHEHLAESGLSDEIIDFSAGGQQVAESMVVLFASMETVRPRIVVVGVSLFSMLRLNVRETLLEGLDVKPVREEVIENLPADADPRLVNDLLAFSRQAITRLSTRGETIQERIDHLLGNWLDRHFAAISNRRVMFNDLVDTPIRRDMAAWFKRQIEAARTARTYRIGAAYPVSLLALETMADLCRSRDARFVVVILPFDGTRPPTPFTPETESRIRSDLESLAGQTGLTLVDESDLLSTKYFGNFVDGSPDNLHFDAAGHDLLAEEISAVLGPMLSADENRAGIARAPSADP